MLVGGRKRERRKVKDRAIERKKERERGGGERESQSVSDQMTLMPLDCRAIRIGGGGVRRWSQLTGRDGRTL